MRERLIFMGFVPIIICFPLVYFYYDYNMTFFGQICDIYQTRGKGFSNDWPTVFKSNENKGSDEQWRKSLVVYGFNDTWKKIDESYLKVLY